MVEGKLGGYICYGPTPMTDGTYDLYWIASDPRVRGQGSAPRWSRPWRESSGARLPA